ncbi:hypothetical protein PHSY_006751 [Pseudozyma hubeiensis SY62]|uniref:Uncharacterized protein n=1 Tax=Pseudozyma hubeiensis (strain SY62) TaxID=1305764 RepID=R9PD23_PSEHS|nr:hypothetical protein PHSY_006751 [Pseudozyma hubeiensis SY62]GAC99152.1 hypothetical protein PHSY_006751 [Pseudozyma hubeiensis SY62]
MQCGCATVLVELEIRRIDFELLCLPEKKRLPSVCFLSALSLPTICCFLLYQNQTTVSDVIRYQPCERDRGR